MPALKKHKPRKNVKKPVKIKSTEGFNDIVFFPEKLARANAILARVNWLPDEDTKKTRPTALRDKTEKKRRPTGKN